MRLTPGYNLKYFSPETPEANFVRKVTASASEHGSKIAFNVASNHKAAIRHCLKEIGVLIREDDTETYGTWFSVIGGVAKIKKSLDNLHVKHLIDDNFYQTLIQRFPKAHGGTLNLSSVTEPLPLIDFELSSLFNISHVDSPQN